jgi:hypothetical protein
MLFAVFICCGLTLWVGGMFFAHMALHPAWRAAEQRLTLMAAVLANFFIWVWVAIALVLGSGLHMMAVMGRRCQPAVCPCVTGIGVVMMLIFAHIFFAPFRRLKLVPPAGLGPRLARAAPGAHAGGHQPVPGPADHRLRRTGALPVPEPDHLSWKPD